MKTFDAPPIRKVEGLLPVLADIESHMPARHPYRDKDRVTWAHETTQGLCARLRGQVLGDGQVIYGLNDVAVPILHPDITLRAIAAMVPEEHQGPNYHLYLVIAAHSWNHQPLYILEEWVAYTYGAMVGKEYKMHDRAAYSLKCAEEFSWYVGVLLDNLPSDYSDREQLVAFVNWHRARLSRLQH